MKWNGTMPEDQFLRQKHKEKAYYLIDVNDYTGQTLFINSHFIPQIRILKPSNNWKKRKIAKLYLSKMKGVS